MKLISGLLTFFLTSSIILAQPVLNSEQYDLVIGKSKKFDFIFDIDTSITGANATWDFSNLDINYVFTNLVEDPSLPALGVNFPDSDFAIGNEISEEFSFHWIRMACTLMVRKMTFCY